MDGLWRASPDGLLRENRLPSDFTEAQVGRIDFAKYTSGNRDAEIRLLRAYFDKNHHWRMGMMGDLREAYGQNNHLVTEQYALRNIVGPSAFTAGGHHDVGETKTVVMGS
jgi:hypothetical protein